MKLELEDIQNEASKYRTKHHCLFLGNCFVYIGQHDRLNKTIETKSMMEVYEDIMSSLWIEVTHQPKEKLGIGCLEYRLNDGKFVLNRFKEDTSD